MICPNCGSNNPDGTAFCANCGSPVSNGAPNNGAIPPQAQPNFQGSAPNGGILYLILAIVGLGIISYALMQNELNQLA